MISIHYYPFVFLSLDIFLFLLLQIYIFWAAHSAHHSSEEYNFSTALRQAMLGHAVDPVSFITILLS